MAYRSFSSGLVRCDQKEIEVKNFDAKNLEIQDIDLKSPNLPKPPGIPDDMKLANEILSDEDILPPGAPVGTIPTDWNQSTGLERLELLGKMIDVDIFDMKPLDSSRLGTMEKPIVVPTFAEERYIGCTGVPRDSHVTVWMRVTRERPIERCTSCGNVVAMMYCGPDDPHHGHAPHFTQEPQKNFSDYVKPEYYYK